ncbi:hypothetical protein CERSUDRAFT_92199 [Gelatoporia subvermispora B]|uniref:Uncharacterized protein n=1 Tax=Ceriporiopsis subvermispora (strain B) TaxID=914234 RepID=M2RLH7_CERS8|nr:hypothetical protein CERSUDRAFT_92199 [Gelatoporia subvermispora B]
MPRHSSNAVVVTAFAFAAVWCVLEAPQRRALTAGVSINVPPMPTSKKLPRLPQEVIDIIIDLLSDDISTLCNCSLTCSSWASRVGAHIFKKVVLSANKARAFRNVIVNNTENGSYIREIQVHHKHSPNQPGLVWKVVLKSDETYTPTSLLQLQSIEVLEIRGGRIDSLDDLMLLMVGLPRLRSIVSRGTDYGLSRNPPRRENKAPPSLRVLDFVANPMTPDIFLNWLVSQSMYNGLESFTAVPIDIITMPHLGKMVQACNATLKHFRICVIGESLGDWTSLFTLKNCTELQVLEMDTLALGLVHCVALPYAQEHTRDHFGHFAGR